MRPDLDALLCSRYPSIFRDRHANMRQSSMCWGFDCEDGWFQLIDVLCQEIDRHAKPHGLDVTASQVKEKFGSLHFYCAGDEYIGGLVWMTEAVSVRICELCGAPGALGIQGWWRTRCELHREAAQATGALPSVRLVGGRSSPPKTEKRVPDFQIEPPASQGWRHLVAVLARVVDHDIRSNGLPCVTLEDVLEEGGRLTFRCKGGDDSGRAAGFFDLISALSERLDPATGQPR